MIFAVLLFVYLHKYIFSLQNNYNSVKEDYKKNYSLPFKRLWAFAKANKREFITAVSLFLGGLLVTSLLFGLRRIDAVYGGTDAIQYKLWYDNSRFYKLFEYLKVRGVEPVLVFFFWLFKRMNFSYTIIQVLYYVLFFTLTAALLLRMPYKKTFNARYIIMVILIITSMNLMRNNLACLVGWHIIISVMNKRLLRAILYSVGAALIHFSALIIIFSVVFIKLSDFLEKKFKNIWVFVSAVGVAFIAVYFIIEIMLKVLPLGKYETYIVGSFATIPTIYKLFFIVLMLLNYKNNKDSNVYRTGFMLLLSSLIIVPLQLNLDICYRMLCYYDVLYVILTPILLDNYKNGKPFTEALVNCGVYGKTVYDSVYMFTVTCISYGLYYFAW